MNSKMDKHDNIHIPRLPNHLLSASVKAPALNCVLPSSLSFSDVLSFDFSSDSPSATSKSCGNAGMSVPS